MDYLDNLSIPEFIDIVDATEIIDKDERSKQQRAKNG